MAGEPLNPEKPSNPNLKPLNPSAEPFTFSSCKLICRPRSFYPQGPQPPLPLHPPPPPPPVLVASAEYMCYSVRSLCHYPTPYYMSHYNAQLQPQPYYKPSSLPYCKDSVGVEEVLVEGDEVDKDCLVGGKEKECDVVVKKKQVSLEDKDCLAGGKEKVDVGVKEDFPRTCGRSNNIAVWVPKKSEVVLRGKTTVMIRHIPNKLSREDLVELLDKYCRVDNEDDWPTDPFRSEYDFVYLPVDFKRKGNKGYAFVNFTNSDAAIRVSKYFHDYKWNAYETKKICKISSAKTQGKEALLRRFRNRNFTCDTDDYLPVVFSPPRNGSVPCTPPKIVGQRAASFA